MSANDSVVSAASLAARALSTPDDGGLRPGRRAGGARFGRAQRAGGVVELLRRGRALDVQAGNACVRRARQREGGLGRLLLGRRGGDALIGRQRGRAGASRLGGEVASVEHDQHLTRAHAIARRRRGLPGPAPRMRAMIVAVVRAWTTPPASNVSAMSAMATVRDRDGNRRPPRRRVPSSRHANRPSGSGEARRP